MPGSPSTRRAPLAGGGALALLLLASACGSGGQQAKGDHGAGNHEPPEVGVVVVQPTAVPLVTELPGRTAAFATSEVRPQVSGIVLKRLFQEGSIVHAGQTLYQIDPSLYRASANQAQANLASAQANAEAARTRAERYRPLAQIQAVSQQDYTDAAAQARQAGAAVQQNQAALQTARINLKFTRVPAPITGRIGRSLFTQGALVTTNQTDPLAVIQQLDPMYVDIQQSSAQLLALRRSMANGGTVPGSATVRLKLEDGSDYGLTGTVQFSEVTVDPSTGSVTLRATFPNPQGLLLPGMFVRAQFAQAVDTRAYLVPQQALTRDPQGNATVFVVGADNKAVVRKVTADRTSGANWVVTAGLQPGDRVVVEGTAKVRPGQPVHPVPAGSPQKLNGGGAGKGAHGEGGAPTGAARGAGGGGGGAGGPSGSTTG